MKISIFYFSGTGNTWWVTQKIKEVFEEKGHSVEIFSIERKDLNWDELLPFTLRESDLIGVGFPVYGSRIPTNMRNWVKNTLNKYSKDHQNKLRAFVYDTMAMFSGDPPLLMKKLLKKGGFKVRQAINIRTLSNLPQMKRIMTWEKEKQEEIFFKAEKKIIKFIDKIIKNRKWLMRRDPITRLIAVIQRVGFKYEENYFRKLFCIDKEICNLCKICVKYCPVENLSIEETESQPIVSYGPDCVFCMRCFNNCPVNAIIVMKRTRDTKKYPRFRNQIPNFKLSSIKE
jgi:ferredoxin